MKIITLLSSVPSEESEKWWDWFSKITTELGKNMYMTHIFIQWTHDQCLPSSSCVSLCPAVPQGWTNPEFPSNQSTTCFIHLYSWCCILLPEKSFSLLVFLSAFLQDLTGTALLHAAFLLCFGGWLLLQALLPTANNFSEIQLNSARYYFLIILVCMSTDHKPLNGWNHTTYSFMSSIELSSAQVLNISTKF